MDYCVLGASTFTSIYFIKNKLEEGKTVLAISRSKNEYLNKHLIGKNYPTTKFKYFKLHLIKDNFKIIKIIHRFKPNFIIDFSGQGMVAESWINPNLWFETNVISKIKIYQSLIDKKWLKKIIKISTPEVYGSNAGKIKEASSFNPSSPYAVSHASIDLFLSINQKFKNLPVIFTRFANFYGEGQQVFRIIPKVILSIIFNKKFSLHGGGRSVRSFIHVSDVSKAIDCTIKKGKIGSTYHFSTEEQISILKLCKKIIKFQNKKFKDVCEITPVDRLGKDKKYDMSFSHTKKELNWKPEIDLNEGIERAYNWYNAHKKYYKNKNWDFRLKK